MNAYTLATTLKDEHTLLVFDYGSVVYGTLTEFSDHDVVAIVDDEIDLSEYTNGIFEYHWDEHPLCPDSLKNQDWQFINERRWIEMIKAHHIVWLECYSLPKEHILKGNPDESKADCIRNQEILLSRGDGRQEGYGSCELKAS